MDLTGDPWINVYRYRSPGQRFNIIIGHQGALPDNPASQAAEAQASLNKVRSLCCIR